MSMDAFLAQVQTMDLGSMPLSAARCNTLGRITSVLPVAELGFGPMLVLADACLIR